MVRKERCRENPQPYCPKMAGGGDVKVKVKVKFPPHCSKMAGGGDVTAVRSR